MIKKAELHVHLEGTATPELIRKLAQRNAIEIPENLFNADNTFRWHDFSEFLLAYDGACMAIKTSEDYRDITYDYLQRCAKQQTIYVELMASPDHAAQNGLTYQQFLDGISRGIIEAKRNFAIEARIIPTCVRHFGVQDCMKMVEQVIAHADPLVVAIGLAGDEVNFPAKDFVSVFETAKQAGLHCTAHAGEMQGAESIWQAIDYLPVSRIGHGVRAIEDDKLIAALIEREITLEVCPASNIALGVYDSLSQHPLRKLFDAGVKVTLNSDDPPYFSTDIGNEYHIAKQHFGFNDQQLVNITRQAIKASFADEATKKRLLQQLV